ncbi:tRNA (cytosine(34)-C(5))-methyltransferase mitochondrial [Bienertia sinuspersici]
MLLWNSFNEILLVGSVLGFKIEGLERASWNDRVTFNMDQSCRWRTIFAVGCWHIWLMRNKEVFTGQCFTPLRLLTVLMLIYVLLTFLFRLIWHNLLFKDIFPCGDDHKWDFTSSTQMEVGRRFRRREEEELLGAMMELGTWALRDGLLLAKHFQISKLEVETDAKSILNMLDNALNTIKHD